MNASEAKAALLAVGLAFACSPAGDEAGVLEPVVLSPSAELADVVDEAAERWAAASGIDVVIGIGGSPVAFAPDLPVCGETLTRRIDGQFHAVLGVNVRPPAYGCGTPLHTLLHEIGHVLCAIGGTDDDCHTPRHALMHRRANNVNVIDDASLETVCSAAPCTLFAPESR